MAIKLRRDSIADIFIIGELTKQYMLENKVSLLDVPEEPIKMKYEEIMDQIELNEEAK